MFYLYVFDCPPNSSFTVNPKGTITVFVKQRVHKMMCEACVTNNSSFPEKFDTKIGFYSTKGRDRFQ